MILVFFALVIFQVEYRVFAWGWPLTAILLPMLLQSRDYKCALLLWAQNHFL
jgi:hypothetical protein